MKQIPSPTNLLRLYDQAVCTNRAPNTPRNPDAGDILYSGNFIY